MSRRPLPLVAGLGAVLLLAGSLAGCATPSADSTPAPSASIDEVVETEAAWLDGGAMIAMVLPGSSTCVPMADDVAYDDGVLSISLLEPPADTACTRDLVMRGIPVSVPEGIDPAHDLRIEVRGDGYSAETQLAGVADLVPGEEGAPSAGWTGTAGTFALLSWGSSSCRPVFEDAAITAPGEVSVTFATPPADQVCTADYTARVSVVAVPDVEPGVAYSAVLSGDSFASDAAPVAIAGLPA